LRNAFFLRPFFFGGGQGLARVVSESMSDGGEGGKVTGGEVGGEDKVGDGVG